MSDDAQPNAPTDGANAAAIDELDASLEVDINPDASQPEAMNLDGANDAGPSVPNGVTVQEPPFEARIPAKKDATLREFLGKMDDYAPIVRPAPHALWGKAVTDLHSDT
jgi:transcription initiation factor TFIID subunit 10